MEPFKKLSAVVGPLNRPNVETAYLTSAAP